MNIKFSIKWKLIILGLCLIIFPSLIIDLFAYNKVYSGVVEMVEHSIRKQTENWETITNAAIGEVKSYKQTAEQTADYDVNYEKKQQEALKNIIAKEIIGKTGYVYVIDSQGNYIVSKDRKRDGEWIWEEKDANGKFFIQEIIKKAKESAGTKDFPIVYYPWKNIGETIVRSKFAAVTYIPEWDWIIGASAYQDDFFDQLYAVRNISAIVFVLLIILGIIILLLFIQRIVKPIKDLHHVTEEMIKGDLDTRVKVPDVLCWEMKKCGNKSCPAYKKTDMPCWYVAGTMCKNAIQGSYAKKIEDCKKCEVYKNYVGDEIQQLSFSFNEMAGRIKGSYEVLEEKVRERTAKLAETAKELEEKKEVILSVLEDTQKVSDILEEEKSKDEIILSSIGEGLVVIDYNMKVIRINNAGEKMLGWKQEELFGKEWFRFVKMLDEHGKEIPLAQTPLGRALTTTTIVVAKNGSIFPIAITASQIKIGPNLFGAVIVFRDITHEKEVDRAKTEFVSLASHQLRTPLSAINWYTEMLLTGDAGKLNKDQKEFLEQVYKGNQRMVSLVNALLNVSRLEMGTFAVNPEPTNIVNLAHSVINELKAQIEMKKMNIIKKFADDLPMLNVDPKLLRIVFQNLLSNAVKYTPQKGKIITQIKTQTNDTDPRIGSAVLISVSDTGYGIPKNQQDKIFTKLFRADNVREKDTDGTGLGLYIAKSIVDNFDGKIWFKSKENKGTTFYVLLPLAGMKKKEGTKSLA